VPLENWIQHCKVAQFLYDWQTIIAGFAALLAAAIAVLGTERYARRKEKLEIRAIRASLAVEIRQYIDCLTQTDGSA
jgi:hypothetical protein